jgi:hypothetical protein
MQLTCQIMPCKSSKLEGLAKERPRLIQDSLYPKNLLHFSLFPVSVLLQSRCSVQTLQCNAVIRGGWVCAELLDEGDFFFLLRGLLRRENMKRKQTMMNSSTNIKGGPVMASSRGWCLGTEYGGFGVEK